MNKKLKSLKEHNDEAMRNAYAFSSNTPKLNGIECPECGEELMDSNPMMTLTSFPAQKEVRCSKCDYKGYRFC